MLTAVVAAAALVAVLELQAARGPLIRLQALLSAALAASMPPAAYLGLDWMTWFVTGVALLPFAALAFARDPRAAVDEWLWAAGLVLAFGWLASHFVLLRETDDGRSWVFLVLLTVWITDTGAYFVGRAVGRHKMAPTVSPGKTWEGAIGGQVAGFAAVVALNAVLDLGMSTPEAIGLGLLLPAVGQVGDLAESAMKRGVGVKDSGWLVPGHGGIADRLDSLLFAAPVAYYFLQWVVL